MGRWVRWICTNNAYIYPKWITGDEHTEVSIYHLPALVKCTGIKRSRDTSLGYFPDELLVTCAASMAWAQNPCCKRKIPLCEEQALLLCVYKKIEEKKFNAFLQSCMSISFYFGRSHYWHGILFTLAILEGADPHRLPPFYGNRSDFS